MDRNWPATVGSKEAQLGVLASVLALTLLLYLLLLSTPAQSQESVYAQGTDIENRQTRTVFVPFGDTAINQRIDIINQYVHLQTFLQLLWPRLKDSSATQCSAAPVLHDELFYVSLNISARQEYFDSCLRKALAIINGSVFSPDEILTATSTLAVTADRTRVYSQQVRDALLAHFDRNSIAHAVMSVSSEYRTINNNQFVEWLRKLQSNVHISEVATKRPGPIGSQYRGRSFLTLRGPASVIIVADGSDTHLAELFVSSAKCRDGIRKIVIDPKDSTPICQTFRIIGGEQAFLIYISTANASPADLQQRAAEIIDEIRRSETHLNLNASIITFEP